MRITFIQPAIGHRAGEPYIKSWQMEPLSIATLSGLTPNDVEKTFYDDRIEAIDFEAPTDLAVLTVETYTAKRAYQIASEYRKRKVPVVMGGFHPTLVPDEAARYAETIVIGEAEAIWPGIVDDARHGTLKPRYTGERKCLSAMKVDRAIFGRKKYLPVGLIETGRGCKFPCEFCAIQTFFGRSYRSRPVESIIAELSALSKSRRVFFFVDDNFAGDIKSGKDMLPDLVNLNLRWITQMSINAAHDEEFLSMMARAGCKGVLIGFETLNEMNLKQMNKRFNGMKGGYNVALANLRRAGISVYGTFIFGYDYDTSDSFEEAADFALSKKMYLAAFNHLTPFPGTPLYKRLLQEGRMRYDAWWTDTSYRYNTLPFNPLKMSGADVTNGCMKARSRFYNWRNIAKRSSGNMFDFFMYRNFFPINTMHGREVNLRNGYPLGDELWKGALLEV